MTRKMHIAKRGKESGKWVTCPAQTKCRIGGVHTTSASLKDAKSFSGKKRIGEITYKEYVGYLKSKLTKYYENEKQENLPTQEEFKVLIVEEKKESDAYTKRYNARMNAEDKRRAEVIAEQDAEFEKIKEFSFSVEHNNGERVFCFVDKANKVILLNNEQAETLREELNIVQNNFSDELANSVLSDDAFEFGPQYHEKSYVSSLKKEITVEEVDRLEAQITTETHGYDAYKLYKVANANAKIFSDELEEKFDNDITSN